MSSHQDLIKISVSSMSHQHLVVRVSNRKRGRKEIHWYLPLAGLKATTVLPITISLVKKADLAFVPDETTVSMQHKVLIQLHYIVPWNKVALFVASPYKCTHMVQTLGTSRHQLTGKEKIPASKRNCRKASPSNGEFHPGACHWNSVGFVCLC
jgi:hypothetical protein